MKNLPLGLIGRIMYALPLLGFAIGHFTNANQMAGMVPSFFPVPVVFVYLTGMALLAAAISIIIQKKAKLATMLLGVMLLLFALLLHLPGVMGGNQISMPGFMKDLSMAGAAFFMSSVFND
ncbi:MAG: DoxX family protein [Cyclobacteriaceae bacterium]|nr:DoxX family protein [Cyclobacteriaceae bacterium]